MQKIDKVLTLVRFIQHGTFIVLSFILFENNNKNSTLVFKIYICLSFVIVFVLYYYIVVYEGGLQSKPASTNRTLRRLLQLEMYTEIEEMYVFGFKYSDEDWHKVIQDKDLPNRNIAGALTTFLSHNVIDVDNIFSSIESVINTQDGYGITLLHDAADDKYGSVECVSKLLQHNANPNIRSRGIDEYSPLDCAVVNSRGEDRLSKLSLLLQAGADVNGKEDGKYDFYGLTPLHYAAESINNHNCIDMLLGVSDVNVNQMNQLGKTPLDYAYEAKTDFRKAKKEENEIIKKNTISKLISAGGKRGLELKSKVLSQDNKA